MAIQQLQKDPSGISRLLSAIGGGLGSGIGQGAESKVLEDILSNQDFTSDPSAFVQAIMGAPVSQQAKQTAFQGYQTAAAMEKARGAGSKPPITLNEQLNRLNTRTQNAIKDLTRPFERADAFGNIMLDFEEDEKKREAVLRQIDKKRQKAAQVASDLYQKSGAEVPQDVLDTIEGADIMFPDKTGKMVSLQVINRIKGFSEDFPPADYKGQTATDPATGMIIQSDGEEWILVEG